MFSRRIMYQSSFSARLPVSCLSEFMILFSMYALYRPSAYALMLCEVYAYVSTARACTACKYLPCSFHCVLLDVSTSLSVVSTTAIISVASTVMARILGCAATSDLFLIFATNVDLMFLQTFHLIYLISSHIFMQILFISLEMQHLLHHGQDLFVDRRGSRDDAFIPR